MSANDDINFRWKRYSPHYTLFRKRYASYSTQGVFTNLALLGTFPHGKEDLSCCQTFGSLYAKGQPDEDLLQELCPMPATSLYTASNAMVYRPATCAAIRNPQNYYLPLDVSSRFGARLRLLRRERNLTQTRMATLFGIDRTFISDVERGRKSISLPLLEVIALGMNLSLSELLRDI